MYKLSWFFFLTMIAFCTGLHGQIVDSTLAAANIKEAALHIKSGKALFRNNKPEKAFVELAIAESLYQHAADSAGLANVYLCFGDYYAENFVAEKAEPMYQKALTFAGPVAPASLSGDIASRLGGIYYRKKSYDNASKYFTTAISQYDKNDLNEKSATAYVSLAAVRGKQKNFSDAEFLIMRRALPLYRSASYTPGRIGCFNVLGEIYNEQKRYSEAKWYFIQANMLARTLRDTLAIAQSLINLGDVKTNIKDYKLALKDFKEAEAISKRKHLLKQLSDVNRAYAKLYVQSGNKPASGASYSEYAKYEDSLNDIQDEKKTTASNMKAEEPPKKAQKKVAKIIAQISQLPKVLLAGAVILLAILAILIIKRRSRKKI